MDEGAVRQEMSRILASPGFQNSGRLSRFLRFTVEAKLKGEDGRIKEYLLGREVFDRNAEYDPRLDPIVRVEARRLRKKLEEFYAAEGGTMRIEFPKGSYAPEFRVLDPESPPAIRRVSRTTRWVLGLAIAVAVIAAGLTFWLRQGQVSIAVVPARWTWKGEDFPAIAYDEDLAELTAAELANAKKARVVAWPVLQKYRNASVREIAKEFRLDQVLIVAVRVEATGFRVTAFRIDGKTDRKLGVYDVPQQGLETLEQRRHVAVELARTVSSGK